MRTIHTPQAKAFLDTEIRLYKRQPASQMIPYMVRASETIRSTSMANRAAAIKLIAEPMYLAWGAIHREMRPYFFSDIDGLFAPYKEQPFELPSLEEMPHIHAGMHYCFDVLVDLDRVTALLQNDPSVGDELTNKVFDCWNGVYRATSRLDGIAKRIRNGKAFNGTT